MFRASAENRAAFKKLLTRTLVLPLGLLSCLCAIFIVGILYLKNLNHRVDRSDQAIAQVSLAQGLFVDAETGLRGYLLTGQPVFLEPYQHSEHEAQGALSRLRDLLADNRTQAARLERIEAKWDQWARSARQRILEEERGRSVPLEESLEGKALMDSIRALVQDVVQEERELRAGRGRAAETASAFVLWMSALLSLSLGGLIAFVGRRQLTALSGRYEETLETQLRQTETLQRQEWVRRGRAQLSDELRGELSEEAVAAAALTTVARYLGAEVGVLYALGSAGVLERRATFACGEGAVAPPATLRPGETWVGRVALEGNLVRLTDLPETHVRVATATGVSSPREIVVAPLTASNVTIGVLELGFLKGVGDPGLEYLAAIAPVAGIALRSARYRSELQDLLRQTQRQAQELQAQKDELHVANKDLEEQSHELQQSQAHLEAQQAELEATNAQLEEQASTLETQRDELERAGIELTNRADQLARTSQYKSEFLANMSHELRTPLNSSLILAKLLADNKDGNLTAEQVRFAETIYSAGNDLLELINDILDLSRIEAGRVDLKPERVPLQEALASLMRTFQPMAEHKHLRLGVHFDSGVATTIETDPQRLQQVLKNLISNAIKFTDHGEVTVRVSSSGPSRVAFHVRDTGIGISGGDLERIFEAFQQVDSSTRRQYGGTGLGLTISRDLARRMGGDIFVDSTLGQGSTFSLVLPARAVPGFASDDEGRPTPPVRRPSPPRAITPRELRAEHRGPSALSENPDLPDDRDGLVPGVRTLLVVEDDPRFARILYDLAHEQRFHCLLASTGAEGIDLARRLRPSAIVLDVNLPDESGLVVLEQLKRSGETRHIPVHVISILDHTQRALEMGAVGYALKPVKREELLEAFQRLERQSADRTRQVLVVEDVAAQRESLCALLRSSGVEITAVETAHEALDQLRSKTFDCMVLDLSLSDMSGFELLQRMSADPAFSFPPVIVYTGRSLTPEEEVQLRRYSKSVVIKGARSPERLLDEVTLFIHRVEADLPREQQRLLREARSREALFEGRRLLLAEDDVRNIFALTSVFEPKGARLEIARNGREAVEALARCAKEGKPVDLVLMDVMMPILDGLSAIREIRSQEEWKKLPIIALTAKAMPDDREKCLAAGANDYIPKPIDVDKLLSLVRVWIPK